MKQVGVLQCWGAVHLSALEMAAVHLSAVENKNISTLKAGNFHKHFQTTHAAECQVNFAAGCSVGEISFQNFLVKKLRLSRSSFSA